MVSAMTEVCAGYSEAQRKNQAKEVIELKQGTKNEFVGVEDQTGERPKGKSTGVGE